MYFEIGYILAWFQPETTCLLACTLFSKKEKSIRGHVFFPWGFLNSKEAFQCSEKMEPYVNENVPVFMDLAHLVTPSTFAQKSFWHDRFTYTYVHQSANKRTDGWD